MKKEMLINVLQPEECRIAIVEDGVLEELYVERASQESYVGNIYKGKVVNIEAAIQAVFIDFGIGRNGFLHVTDVDPIYYKHLLSKEMLEELEGTQREDRGRPQGRGTRPAERPTERPAERPRNDRGTRFAEAEAVESMPFQPAPTRVAPEENTGFAPPLDDDEDGFDSGLDEPDVNPDAIMCDPTLNEPEDSEDDDIPFLQMPPPLPKPVAKLETIPLPAPEPIRYSSDDDFDDFGAGLDLDFDAPSQKPKKPVVEAAAPAIEMPPPLPIPLPASAITPAESLVELTTAEKVEEAAGEPIEDRPVRGKSREKKPSAKRTAKKADEAEEKPKPKAKRGTKKKADGEAETEDDDKPRPMESAECRTSDDDEPEIQPFFDASGDDDFDPEGENDRFANSPSASDDDESDEEDYENESEETEPAVPDEEFDADAFIAPSQRGEESDSGRGGRGGRSGNDRGSRGGPRAGGGGGGGRGGPGGPRGGNGNDRGPRRGPPSKAHTRHKGMPIPPIQEIFKRGQEVIIQVIKEGIGTKGPTLSTFISIAGRYLVLMPSLNRVGVSRKIEDRDARHRLRDIMDRLNPPDGVGFIVRTAAVDQTEQELQSDLGYLLRLWQVVVRRIKRVAAPVEIYRESDMITRTIRDIFSKDIDTIWVDEEHSFASASEFLQIVMPNYASRIRFHGGSETEPLFHKYRIEDEIAKINHKRLDLPGGGSIIIEQTEALVAIDVNSGNFRADNNAEENAYQMNMRAAKEIARQLRLRDLGGVIVNDFIDMRSETHRRNVEQTLRDALRRDRARTKILRISEFGIIEMTRQRMQPSLKKRIFNECSHCAGTGYVKTNETMGIEVMRLLHLAAHRANTVSLVQLSVHMDVAFYVLNRKRKELAALEAQYGMEVQVQGVPNVSPDLCDVKFFDANGTEVRAIPAPVKPLRLNGGNGNDQGRPRDDRGSRRRNNDD